MENIKKQIKLFSEVKKYQNLVFNVIGEGLFKPEGDIMLLTIKEALLDLNSESPDLEEIEGFVSDIKGDFWPIYNDLVRDEIIADARLDEVA